MEDSEAKFIKADLIWEGTSPPVRIPADAFSDHHTPPPQHSIQSLSVGPSCLRFYLPSHRSLFIEMPFSCLWLNSTAESSLSGVE